MEANKILSADVLDLIFEDRNKEYGAYNLRKTYNRRIARALIITASVSVLAIGGSLMASNLKVKNDNRIVIKDMNLAEIKPEEKKIIPPPPPPPKVEPPKVEMKQFTPPKIMEDDKVEKPPPPVEDLKDVKIDVVDREGIKDENIVTPVVIDGGTKIIEDKPQEDENKIFDKVEIEAKFPGGDSRWRQYLERECNAQVAIDNGAPEGTYQTVVQFVVDKEGNISDVKPLTNHGYGMEAEAIRVIKKGPKWEPAIQNNLKVKAFRKQPITFQVPGD